MGRINSLSADHMEAAQLATCSQVEYWVGMGEDMSKSTGFKSLSIGSFSVDFGEGSGGATQLASRSRQYLNDVGLLYRGVRTNDSRNTIDSDLSN